MPPPPEDPLSARASRRVGTVLCGRYRLTRLIGLGGMGAVYAGVHVRNGHLVAVKVLHDRLAGDPEHQRLFRREGLLANQVKHPGAVPVLDDDEAEDGAAFLVLPLLSGETLRHRWERSCRVLPVDEVVHVAHAVLEILAAAHAAKIVHRDVKPENVFVTTSGEIRVLDFGIARVLEAGDSPSATRTGLALGTPAFMAPEQALGRSREIDARTDLWAVGATMFTLLSGRLVHEGESSNETLIRAGTRPARSLGEVAPSVPGAIAKVVDRALAFEKDGRWGDAGEMDRALGDAYAEAYGRQLESAAGLLAVADEDAGPREGPGTEVLEGESRDGDARQGQSTRTAIEAPATRTGTSRRFIFAPLVAAIIVAGGLVAWRLPSRHASNLRPTDAGTSSEPSAITIADIPIPESRNPEATAAYREAMQRYRDGDMRGSAQSFGRAIELDSTYAAALYRRGVVSFQSDDITSAREDFEKAAANRAAMPERERLRLAALEPMVRRVPPDMTESRRLLADLVQGNPRDAELRTDLAYAESFHAEESAILDAQKASVLDPEFAFPYLYQAFPLESMGRFNDANAAFQECFRAAPRAIILCATQHSVLVTEMGERDALAVDAERLLASAPADAAGYRARADVLVAREAPRYAMDENVLQWTARLAPGRSFVLVEIADSVALAYGDFAEILARDADAGRALNGRDDLRPKAAHTLALVEALFESGRAHEAARMALVFLNKRELWQSGANAGVNRDVTPRLLAVAEQGGAIDHAASRREASAYVDRWRAWSAADPTDGWFAAASVATTGEEAQAVLGSMPDLHGQFEHRVNAIVGEVYRLAGRYGEAISSLEKASGSCAWMDDAIGILHATMSLAAARESTGDTPGACSAYATVLSHWGAAKPRSVTADAARARIAALGCK